MICPLCKGSGSLITYKPITWWLCSACAGQGVIWTSIINPIIMVGRHQAKRKKAKQVKSP